MAKSKPKASKPSRQTAGPRARSAARASETRAGGASASSSHGAALENALIADPNDLGAHAAYADWLSEQGDPRGEFIQVQLALEDEQQPARQRKQLQKREQELLKKHGKGWLGDLAPFLWKRKQTEVAYSFVRGWLDHVSTAMLTGPLARALAASPQTRLLRSLHMGDIDHWIYHTSADDADDGNRTVSDRDCPGLMPLAGSGHLANLRFLSVGDLYELRASEFYYSSFHVTELNGLAALVPGLPRLEQLILEGNLKDTNSLFELKTLHNLEALQVCFSKQYPLEVLAGNRSLKKLFYIMFHPQGVGADETGLTLPGVKALVNSPHLESLTQLRLHMTTIGDKGCEVIVKSGILERLEVLDLAFGNITDDGAKILAGSPHLKNLELLDLQRNALTKKGIAVLRKAGIEVHADEQHDPGDESYLYDGEME